MFRATFENFRGFGWFSPTYTTLNNFPFKDPCFGMTYLNFSIFVENQGMLQGPPFRVVNPLLQPNIVFYLSMADYKDAVNESNLCGDLIYNFSSTDNYKLFKWQPSDQDEYDSRFDTQINAYIFELGSTVKSHVGNYTMDVTIYSKYNDFYYPKGQY